MNKKQDEKKTLSLFLRHLAEEIDEQRVPDEDLRSIWEMKMRIEGSKSIGDLDEDTVKKYLFMGWWIHENIKPEGVRELQEPGNP